MKQIALFLSLVLTLSMVSCTTTAPSAAPGTRSAPSPAARAKALTALRVEGHRIVNTAGEEVRLRGVNAGTWLLIEPWMILMSDHPDVVAEKDIWDILDHRFGREKKLELIRVYRENFFTEQDVARIADLGLNCLRVPIWWRAVSDPDYGGDMAYLDRVIEWCSKNGIYVILDLHGAPGGQNDLGAIAGERNNADLWKQEIFKEQSVEWWEQVAERYKGNPVVAGFDLLNEAVSATMDDLVDLYDRMYHAIRKIDPYRILIIEDGLLGFHRLPRPLDMGWDNVVYSIHYYPQNTEEGINAPAQDFHRMHRSALWFGVPMYMGEFNSIQLDRGGAASFLRHMEVFDYFGWSWTWWSFKKIEDNVDNNWGLTGYVPESPAINLHKDSFETIRDAFVSFRSEFLGDNPLLETVLSQPIRWKHNPMAPGTIRLGLDTIYLYPENGDMRFEWGRSVPNIGYWGPNERVAWPVNIRDGGTYELGIRFANNNEANAARIWLDGALVTDAALRNSGGWNKYRDQTLIALELSPGRHVIEISQADEEDGFINLQDGWLKQAKTPAANPSETEFRLHPLNATALRKGTPMRVEWWHNPPNFGFWESGEEVSWSLPIANGGEYRLAVSYSTPSSQTTLTVLLDGKPAWSGKLPSSGGWHEFTDHEPEAVLSLEPGSHEISLIWEIPQAGGAGNLRGMKLTRTE